MANLDTIPEPGSSERLGKPAQAQLAQVILKRQLALSIRVAVVFLVVILGLPLLNWLAPDLMARRIGGFTLSWLLLGILFYPLTWALSGYFIRHSDHIEADLTQEFGTLRES